MNDFSCYDAWLISGLPEAAPDYMPCEECETDIPFSLDMTLCNDCFALIYPEE